MGGDPRREERLAQKIAEAVLDVPETLIEPFAKRAFGAAPRFVRSVAKHGPAIPRYVYEAADFARQPDKLRAMAGLAGGVAGGVAGTAVGGALGAMTGPAAPLAVPLGAAVGANYGEELATDFYDKHHAATKAWMKARWAELRRAGNGVPRAFYEMIDSTVPLHPRQLR